MSDPLISVDHVSFHYQSDVVLDDVTLEVRRGDFLGVIGPNGSGKTTLLKIMLGLLTPASGTVSLFGQPIATFTDWQKIGYVPQKAGAAATISHVPISVEEVVGLGHAGSSKAVVRALRSVGMDAQRKKLLSELSGGQQQRVFIARALVTEPELLILDEPTVGVDVESQAAFYELLRTLHQKHGLTLVLVSHDIDVVAHEVKTVACINRTLIFHGTPKDVMRGDFIEKLYGKNLRFIIHGH